jgi:WhiB family redox-sensing transcriptional regulator
MIDADLFVPRPAFFDDAECAGITHVMFPTTPGGVAAAQRVCRRCDVQAECLSYALTRGEVHGVWGGLSEVERDEIRRPLLQVTALQVSA